jgi:heat shock transcription factor
MNALAPYNYASQLNQFTNFGNTSNTGNLNTSQQGANANGPMSPRSTAAAASAFNLDPSILQTTIGSLLQSPAAAQLFLNSLNNSVQGQTLNTPNPVPTNQPSFPFPTNPTQAQTNNQFPSSTDSMGQSLVDALDPTLALFSPLPNQDGLMDHSDNLLKSYQGAAGMNQDVDKLQESIDSLVRSMGLEPTNNSNFSSGSGSGSGSQQPISRDQQQPGMDGSANGFDMGGNAFDNNFDVDQFLTELAESEQQVKEEQNGQ